MPKTSVTSGGRARSKPAYRVQVLDRTLAILDVLANANGELSPSDLAEHLSLHRSTTHRLLQVLERHRFIRRNPTLGKYGLGFKLFELGSRALAQIDLPERGQPFLRRLVEITGETAHICVLDGTHAVSIANAEGPRTLRTPATIGRRSPVHCTSVGKALIAFLPDSELNDLIARIPLTRFTRNTLVTRSSLKTELLRVRERNFAMDNEEVEEGLRCVGTPIRDHLGRVVASMSIAGPVFRITKEQLPRLVRAVVSAGTSLSEEIGYKSRQSRDVGKLLAGARVTAP